MLKDTATGALNQAPIFQTVYAVNGHLQTCWDSDTIVKTRFFTKTNFVIRIIFNNVSSRQRDGDFLSVDNVGTS